MGGESSTILAKLFNIDLNPEARFHDRAPSNPTFGGRDLAKNEKSANQIEFADEGNSFRMESIEAGKKLRLTMTSSWNPWSGEGYSIPATVTVDFEKAAD